MPKELIGYEKIACKLCSEIPEFTHDFRGTSIMRGYRNKECKCSKRWLKKYYWNELFAKVNSNF
jgi:hypothetical protein